MKFESSGLTLLEVVIALAIISLMGAAVIALTVQSQSLANSAVLKNQATKHAEEQLEQFREYRDYCGWDALIAGKYSGVNLATTTCTPTDLVKSTINQALPCGRANSATLSPTLYSVCIETKDPDPGTPQLKQIISNIYYLDHSQAREVNISLFLADL